LPETCNAANRYDPGLSFLLHPLGGLDAALLDATQAVRWEPLTALFVVASTWWFKWPLLAALGVLLDLRARRAVPVAGLGAVTAALCASGIATVVKNAADRVRPELADPGIRALVATPDSASFPSGHAAAAFAAAVAVAIVYPRFRWPLLGLASTVALSRVYLGVHYWSDVVAGGALGALIGYTVSTAFLFGWSQRSRKTMIEPV
jgi:undecaprenyl-diphosphatase